LCGVLIVYRAWLKISFAQKIGFYGFGSSGHILMQVAKHEKKEIFVFVKKGDFKGENFALKLGATWAGSSDTILSSPLDAAIIFAPDGNLVPFALRNIRKGGTVVCAGIHMSDIPSFSYDLLWGERQIFSIANLTRKDGEDFLKMAPSIPIQTVVNLYALEQANKALEDLREGKFNGSAVIQI
jgi:propanol-preferring alcohol dehydrogenase